MNQNTSILYGHGSLPLALPTSVKAKIIEKPGMSVLPDPVQAIHRALVTPVDCEALSILAQKAINVCILICDITRPVPNGLILPPLIETLLQAGIAAQNITVLVATGLHRPNLGDELRELVGSDWVLQTVRVENHIAKDDAAHVEIGVTSRNTHVKLDRRFVEADLKIVTGLVEPHFMAGYSGGRKVISPGVAHAETIGTFHSTRFMENPAVRNCNFEGNDLHAEQIEIVKMLGTVYAVNTCLDEQRRLAFVNFGEIVSSHQKAVAFMRQSAEIPVSRQYRCVITSGAGYPLDKTYYQTIKGIVGALGALENGGTLLIASECSEGLGSSEFQEAQALLVEKGIDGFLQEARSRQVAKVDEWQTVKLIEALRDYRVHLYATGLNASQQRLTGAICHNDWLACISAVLNEAQTDEIAVIPEGPYVIPFLNKLHS